MDISIKTQIEQGLNLFTGIVLPVNFIEKELKKLGVKPEEESTFFYVVCRGDAQACAAVLIASFHKFLFVHPADLWTLGNQNKSLPQLDTILKKVNEYNEWRLGKKDAKPEWFNERDDWHNDTGSHGPKMK